MKIRSKHPPRYLILLVALVLLGVLYPFSGLGTVVWTVSFWVVLYFSLRAMQCGKATMRFAQVLLGVVVLAGSLGLMDSEWAPLGILDSVVSLTLLTLTTAEILKDVLLAGRVNLNRILGSVCVYIMLGLMFAYAFWVLLELDPQGAFRYVDSSEIAPPVEKSELLYFSFTTLTTLGYGDLVPSNGLGKLLAPAEAIVGQLYLTILVARLVGLHISHSHQKN